MGAESEVSIPRGDAHGFRQFFRQDLLSGFLVFLIALPLCLGISLACGYPPIAGIFTAIIGSVLATFISDSELTIKGPAAGLIVIAIGCIEDFGGDGMLGGWSAADMTAYRAALAVGVAAAIMQILFALCRSGILGEFFPVSAVHGMLAAIGVIIIIKQFPVALGVTAGGEPLEMVQEFPRYIAEANPAIAVIGLVSMIIMFAWPSVGRRVAFLKPVPAPLVVLIAAVPLGMGFDLLHEHSYTLQGHQYQLGEQYLVRMPDRVFGMFDDVTFPEFAALSQPKAWKWVFMFFVIGSLESLLSAKAVDILDPWRRKTNLDRDMLAVGVGNLCAAGIGGLPMISEIVRSKANIDNGARTRFADMWHGLFLLACVALIPTVLHRIPLAALASMLVYTGYRLAHPSEFLHVYRIGREQLAIFATTLVIVLATDLLIGVAAGIGLKMLIHISNGVPLKSLFKPYLEVEEVDSHTTMIVAYQSAVFSNWIPLKRQIDEVGLVQHRNLILDFTHAQLVDHSVMEKLHALQSDFEQAGLRLELRGLDAHQQLSDHPLAARKRGLATIKRITVIAPPEQAERLIAQFVTLGVTGYTLTDCEAAGRHTLQGDAMIRTPHARLEVLVAPDAADSLIDHLRSELLPEAAITASVETIEIIRTPGVAKESSRELQTVDAH